jgi:hypothetical protein
VTFNVTGGTFSTPNYATVFGGGGAASPINVNLGGCGAGLMSGTIANNTITNDQSLTGPGIRIIGNGPVPPVCPGPAGTMTVAVTSNSIAQVANRGIDVLARDGSNTLNATITDNTITLTDPGSLDAIRVDSAAASTDTTTVCAAISGNNATTIAGLFGVRVRQRFTGSTFRLAGYAGSATDDAAVAEFVNNTNSSTPAASADHGGAGFVGVPSCPAP